ncbi:MAG: phosphoribosyltransferase family protein [Promethearchaeia archaeon]
MTFEKYTSRYEAGTRLVNFLHSEDISLYQSIQENPRDYFCFAIPNGGVPVAEGFCSQLDLFYDLIIVRKIKIPSNPEAGFGSIATDGTILINNPLLNQLNLSEHKKKRTIELTKQEIHERLDFYDKNQGYIENLSPKIKKREIFLIDDGLASGFTMRAAIKMVKKYEPNQIFIVVPTAPQRTVEKINPKVKKIFCPNIKNVFRFAVASAYKHWYDLSESEVLEILNQSEHYQKA